MAKNAEYAKSIGVDVVVDYKQENILDSNKMFDSIYDFVGNMTFSESKNILNKKGAFITANPNVPLLVFGGLMNLFRSKKCKGVMVKSSSDNLKKLKDMAESEALRTTVEQIFPLEEVRQAHTLSESGRVVGKVVLSLK